MGNGENNSKKKSKICNLDRFKKYIPPFILGSIVVSYFLVFFLTYFAPLLFPDFVGQFPTRFHHVKEFHEFYDHKYRLDKGETKIWVEFAFFLVTYTITILSIFLTTCIDPGETPNDSNWKIQIPDDVPSEVQEEIFVSAVINREELLERNRNVIIEPKIVTKDSNNDMFCLVNERTSKNKVRFCMTCEKFKPDRTHHCKLCKKCILKHDHHCPWIGNCIGFNNYKYFVIMIAYAFICTLFFNIVFTDVIKFMIRNEKIVNAKLILFLSYYILIICLCLSLGIFCGFHLYITLRNYTTYEYITKVIRKNNNSNIDPMTKVDETSVSMFDVGAYENFKQVFGSNLLCWFLPINRKNKDYMSVGLSFKINQKFEFEVVKSV